MSILLLYICPVIYHGKRRISLWVIRYIPQLELAVRHLGITIAHYHTLHADKLELVLNCLVGTGYHLCITLESGISNSYSTLSVRYGSNTALALGRFAPSGLVLCLRPYRTLSTL